MANKGKLKSAELYQAVTQSIAQAVGNTDGGDVADNRTMAADYYYGKPRGDEVSGRSRVISMDVADMIEAAKAGILPAFEIDNAIEFEPLSQDDEKQARLESAAVNHFIMVENNGYVMFQEALHEAMLYRNCIGKTWVEETSHTSNKKYEGLTEMEAYTLQETANSQDEQIRITFSPSEQEGLLDADVTITKVKRYLKVKCIDTAAFFYAPNHESIYLEGIPFCGEKMFLSRSQLINEGYDKKTIYGLRTTCEFANKNSAQRSRDANGGVELTAFQKAQEMIECYDVIYQYDEDGDGKTELHNIFIAGDKIINDEIVEFIPFFAGAVFLQPHRFEGLSLFDKLKQVQDVKTATLRNMLNNFENSNFARVEAVQNMVIDPDALENPEAAQVIWTKGPGVVTPIPVQDIGGAALQLLTYQDQVRTDRGGAALELQTGQGQVMSNQTATAAMASFSVKEQLSAMMCRTFAETFVAECYKTVHKALRLYMGGKISFRNAGQFMNGDSTQWPERNRVNVKGGLSAMERNKKGAALNSVIQQQGNALTLGQGVLVNLPGIYSALIDQARCMGIDNPERYYIDPASDQSRAAQEAQAKSAQAQYQQQQALQQGLLNLQLQINENNQAMEKYKADQEATIKLILEYTKQDTEFAKIYGAHFASLEQERFKNAMSATATVEGVISDEQAGTSTPVAQ